MKKIQLILLLAFATAITLPSCKKGADDPAISFRSRKSRVAGDWKVDSKEEVKNIIKKEPSVNSNATITTSITGSTYTSTYKELGITSSTVTDGTVGENTYTFEKDGKWSSIYELTLISVLGTAPFATTETTVTRIVSTGIWNFLGKIGDAKNKENMSVSTTSEITTTTTTKDDPFFGLTKDIDTETKTYAPNETVEIWKLTELRNKQLKAEIEINNTTVNSVVNNSETTSIKITLKQ